jgi:hypothetical protein
MTVEPRALFCNPGSIHSFPFTTDWRSLGGINVDTFCFYPFVALAWRAKALTYGGPLEPKSCGYFTYLTLLARLLEIKEIVHFTCLVPQYHKLESCESPSKHNSIL